MYWRSAIVPVSGLLTVTKTRRADWSSFGGILQEQRHAHCYSNTETNISLVLHAARTVPIPCTSTKPKATSCPDFSHKSKTTKSIIPTCINFNFKKRWNGTNGTWRRMRIFPKKRYHSPCALPLQWQQQTLHAGISLCDPSQQQSRPGNKTHSPTVHTQCKPVKRPEKQISMIKTCTYIPPIRG